MIKITVNLLNDNSTSITYGIDKFNTVIIKADNMVNNKIIYQITKDLIGITFNDFNLEESNDLHNLNYEKNLYNSKNLLEKQYDSALILNLFFYINNFKSSKQSLDEFIYFLDFLDQNLKLENSNLKDLKNYSILLFEKFSNFEHKQFESNDDFLNVINELSKNNLVRTIPEEHNFSYFSSIGSHIPNF